MSSVRYSIIERIAVGGMGEVFLARQEGIGGFRRTVVLKRLLPGLEHEVDEVDIVRRFLDEARVAAALAHENVVSILEVGDDAGRPFLSLEYVHGENAAALRNKARKKDIPFPVVVVARIVADAARGLAHAHDAHDVEGRPLHIVHRDVSPKNIFVRADGLSKIGDFGVAKSSHRLSKTETGLVPGTLAYMSPEQALSGDVDGASDQFSLGIVLWELLAGERLFRADSPNATVRATLTKHITPPSFANPDAAPLDDVVLRMLERSAHKRFATLADVASAIEAALPETRAELGQRAVSTFVDVVCGDELRDRQRKIEQGPDDTAVSARKTDSEVLFGEGPTPSPFEGFKDARTSLTPATPPTAERTDVDVSAGAEPAVTLAARKRASSSSSLGSAEPTRPELSRRREEREPRRASDSEREDSAVSTHLQQQRAPRRSLSRRRVSAAAGAVAAGAFLVASAVGARVALREPTNDERTLAYLVEARELNPLIHREMFLGMAGVAGVDGARSGPVADVLAGLVDERLALLEAHQRRSAEARESERSRVAATERLIEQQARAALASLENDELALEALDMWDYDASAPVRWVPPDPPSVVQSDLAAGGLQYAQAQAAARRRAVDGMLARAHAERGVDVAAVHAKLDPIVSERERLMERAVATTSPTELTATLERIAALADEGKRVLVELCGSRYGRAAAALAFVYVPHPRNWDPLHNMPPSELDDLKRAPETH